jgi:hypothetical protein
MQKGYEVIKEGEELTGTRKALIISVSDYYNTSNLQTLDFCKNDGEEMYQLLDSLGYEILDNHKLVGHVRFDTMRDAIYDFFDNAHTKAEDTLVFYYSGHGVPAPDGDMCLASSEINPDDPYRRGFSSYELTRLIQNSNSIRIVTILDCCYSGAAKISKGLEDAAAKIGTAAIQDKARILQQPQGEGKCLLAASQAAQEAYGLKEHDHSIFTYYLLQGLRGNEKSVDTDGNVTPYSLGSYIYRTILNLPPKKRPKQKPITKVEASGDIILASYPNLVKPAKDVASAVTIAPPTPPIESTTTSPLPLSQPTSPPPQSPTPSAKDTSSSSPSIKEEYSPQPTTIKEKKKQQPWTNPKILVPIIAIAVIAVAVVFFMMRPIPSPTDTIPIANAGTDQTVSAGDVVTLDGSKSSDPDGNIVSYLWKQIGDPIVVLSDPNSKNPSFTAPSVTSDTKLTFDLIVKDDKDATSSKSDRVDVIVKPKTPPIGVNNPPIANGQSVMANMSTPVDITLTASDPEINDNLTAAIVSKPLHGTLSGIDQNTGVVTYTPNTGFIGSDSFAFKVNDGKVDSNPGTVEITVDQQQQQPSEPLNHPPIVSNQSVTTSMNKPVDITLTASDPDINDTLTAAIVSPPSNGRLSDIDQNTGVVTYTPNTGFIGSDSFAFKVNDGKVDSNNAGAVSITVNEDQT